MTHLNIAGWRVRLVCTPDALDRAAAGRYAAFVTAEDEPPHLAVEAAASPADRPVSGLSSILEMPLARDATGYRLDAVGVSGVIALAQGRATLGISGGEPLSQIEYFLRSACALLAFRDGGLLLHAAGLLTHKGVLLFTGVSGSGKSTVMALSPHATALSDDLVLLRPDGAGWIAHGTPFWNPETATRAGQTASGRIAGIYKLVKSPDVRLEALSPAAAAAELAANCPVVNGQQELLPALLVRCRALAGAAPMQRLHFRKDASFWEVLN